MARCGRPAEGQKRKTAESWPWPHGALPSAIHPRAVPAQQTEEVLLDADLLAHPILLVHDEVHWEATPGGAADRYLNDDALRLADNVLTLCVSATPFNVLTQQSQIPEENEVRWEVTPAGYYGQSKYVDPAKYDSFTPGSINGTGKEPGEEYDKRWKENQKKCKGSSENANRKAANVLTLVDTYVAAFERAKGGEFEFDASGLKPYFEQVVTAEDGCEVHHAVLVVPESPVRPREVDGEGHDLEEEDCDGQAEPNRPR